MNTISPLPDSLIGWSEAQRKAAIKERKVRVDEIADAHTAGSRASVEDVAEMRQINNDLERLNDAEIVRKPIHRGDVDRSLRSKSGRQFASIGEAIISGLGGGGSNLDVAFQAAFDGTSGSTASPSFYNPDLQAMPRRRLYLRDLIPTVPIDTDRFEYVRHTVDTNAAAAVAAGALKPTSTITVERISDRAQVIATTSEAVDRMLLADFRAAVGFLEGVVVAHVLEEEEDQLVNGSGVSPNLTGILNTAGIQTQALGTDPIFDAIHKALTKIRLSNFEPSAIVLHPSTWEKIRLARTTEGEYLVGKPFEPGAEKLFGKQVLTTSVIAASTGLVGAFDQGAAVYDRQEARVVWAETGLGNNAGEEMFLRNQVRVRAESRIGLGVAFPAAFCQVTGL